MNDINSAKGQIPLEIQDWFTAYYIKYNYPQEVKKILQEKDSWDYVKQHLPVLQLNEERWNNVLTYLKISVSLREEEIAKVEITSGHIYISDPGYRDVPDIKRNVPTNTITKYNYELGHEGLGILIRINGMGLYSMKKLEGSYTENRFFLDFRLSIDGKTADVLNVEWIKVGVVGVDSGTIMVSDPIYGSIGEIPFTGNRLQTQIYKNSKLMGAICDMPGDGTYPVYIRNDEQGNVAEIRISGRNDMENINAEDLDIIGLDNGFYLSRPDNFLLTWDKTHNNFVCHGVSDKSLFDLINDETLTYRLPSYIEKIIATKLEFSSCNDPIPLNVTKEIPQLYINDRRKFYH